MPRLLLLALPLTGCDLFGPEEMFAGPPPPRLTSVTAGMEPPAPGCTICRFDPPVYEPGRYVVFVSFQKDLGSPQVAVASVFEW